MPEGEFSKLGKAMKNARKSRGFTQEQLSNVSSVSVRHIAKRMPIMISVRHIKRFPVLLLILLINLFSVPFWLTIIAPINHSQHSGTGMRSDNWTDFCNANFCFSKFV